jgi:hypothetical protein
MDDVHIFRRFPKEFETQGKVALQPPTTDTEPLDMSADRMITRRMRSTCLRSPTMAKHTNLVRKLLSSAASQKKGLNLEEMYRYNSVFISASIFEPAATKKRVGPAGLF